MHILSNDWSLSLDLNGGRIKELYYKKTKVFGTYKRVDGKVGNTHVCIPSFDKEGQSLDLPFHGLVRNVQWKVKSKSNASITISSNTNSLPLYPAKLYLEQEFDLEPNFVHIIRVTNNGEKEVPINVGLHYYWDTPRGWNEIKIQNKNQKEKIEGNGFIDLSKKSDIIFSHASYELISNGFNNAVLWTSFTEGEQGKRQYSQDFCCIEPVIGWPGYFGTKPSMVSPGETVSVSIEIKRVK